MSDLLGKESVSDGKQVIVVHARDFSAGKRIFRDFSVVGCNGEDTDMSPVFGKPCVLIGHDAVIHAGILHATGSTVKLIADDLDPYLEWNQALDWAKARAELYQPSTGAAQGDHSDSDVIPLSSVSEPDADPTLIPEIPQHVLEVPPDDALPYPDSGAFRDPEAPPIDVPSVDWAEPADVFQPILPEVFPHGILPAFLSDHIMDASQRKSTAAAFTAVADVTALAAACDDAFLYTPMQRDRGFRVRPCLWAITVGPSGAGKDPAMLSAVEHLAVEDTKRSIEVVKKNKDYDRNYRRWKAMEEDWIKNTKKNPQGIGNEFFEVPEPERETDKCLMFNDINIPSAGEFLKDHPRGMFVYVGEASSWLGNMDAYSKGSGESSDWRAAYDGGPKKIKRIGRGEIIVPNWSACVLGGITPSILRSALGRNKPSGDGLFQRMLIGAGGNQGPMQDREPDDAALSAYRRVISQLIEWDGDKNQCFTSSLGATECYIEFCNELKSLQEHGRYSDLMQSHIGKIRGMLPRLVLTLHLAQAAERGKYPSYSEPIGTDVMERAVAFFRWQLSHIQYFWEDAVGGNPMTNLVQQFCLFLIAKRRESITNREIDNELKDKWRAMDFNERMRFITQLQDLGIFYAAPSKNRMGLPSTHLINPLFYVRFGHRTEAEAQRRRAAYEMLQRLKAEKAEREATQAD